MPTLCPKGHYCNKGGKQEQCTPESGCGPENARGLYGTDPDVKEPVCCTSESEKRIKFPIESEVCEKDPAYCPTVCNADKYADSNAKCQPCPKGYQCPRGYNQKITLCPKNYYCEGGLAKQCPEGKTAHLECSERNMGVFQDGNQYYSLCRLPQSELNRHLTVLTSSNAPWLKPEATCEHNIRDQGSGCLSNEERFPANKNICGCKHYYYRDQSFPKSNGCKKCPLGHTCAGGFTNGKHAQPVILEESGRYVDPKDGMIKWCKEDKEDKEDKKDKKDKCIGKGFFSFSGEGYYSSVCCEYITNKGGSKTPVALLNHREVYRNNCDLFSCKGCADGSFRVNGKCEECGNDWLGYRCPGGGEFKLKGFVAKSFVDADPKL